MVPSFLLGTWSRYGPTLVDPPGLVYVELRIDLGKGFWLESLLHPHVQALGVRESLVTSVALWLPLPLPLPLPRSLLLFTRTYHRRP